VCFSAVLHFPHPRTRNVKREHRTVCLPDFQGVGIGNAMSEYIGSMCKALGFRFMSQTSHPSMIAARNRSQNWVMREAPTHHRSLAGARSTEKSWMNQVRTRNVASFEYVGRAMPRDAAEKLWGGAYQ